MDLFLEAQEKGHKGAVYFTDTEAARPGHLKGKRIYLLGALPGRRHVD